MFSTPDSFATESISDANGDPVNILEVTLIAETSPGRCVLGLTYGFGVSLLSVRGGCAGNFSVCYETGAVSQPDGGVNTTIPTEPATATEASSAANATDNNNSQAGVDTSPSTATSANIGGVNTTFTAAPVNQSEVVGNMTITTTATPPPSTSGPAVNVGLTTSSTITNQTGSSENMTSSTTSSSRQNETTSTNQTPKVDTSPTTASVTTDDNIPSTTQGPPPFPQNLTCQEIELTSSAATEDMRFINDTNDVPADIRSMELLRPTPSVSGCEKGSNFFYMDSTIVARDGCSGVFNVCYVETTCEQRNLLSGPGDSAERYTFVPDQLVGSEADTSVTIRSVSVDTQLGILPCMEWESFYYRGLNIFVREGCHALFRVCYV